ncbi:hypothetical protein Fcan01_11366 [Folsomia candida]|uniref:Uncharacterized protein n=1 Tax=Folsomia candida TaxID=158441 RepID=A0A226ECY1_FOLCA|nr:hypothetical protein Fcan01_11366 [Folsomia candida]
MDNFLRKLASPVSHSETSYLPAMTSTTKWLTKSFAIPIISEFGGQGLSVINKIKHWAIYVFTALLFFFHNVTYAFWFYENIYLSNVTESLQVWQKVISFFFLSKHSMVLGIHLCLLFRRRELLQVMKTCAWIESKCLGEGASNYTKISILSHLDASKFSLFAVPIVLGTLGLFRPCMPPSIANTLILECRDGWGDQDAALWVRLMNGLVQGSVGLSVAAVIVTTIKRIFLYPAVMVELWIKTIERSGSEVDAADHTPPPPPTPVLFYAPPPPEKIFGAPPTKVWRRFYFC